jgi:dipeptide/tripeptide permease
MSIDDEEQHPATKRRCGCFDVFVDNFDGLKQSPRFLWIMYLISFLDSLSYYAFSYALIMHLGVEVGLPDSVAGIFYGLFGICISIATLILGFAADIWGIRNSICISAVVGFVAR